MDFHMKTNSEFEKNENRDPITGEPGSHPVGTAVGSASGAAAGAALGALGGPIGMAIGGVVGAVAGGSVGHGVAEELDPTAEHVYWEKNHRLQPYYIGDYDYNDYGPAYRLGSEGFALREGRTFEEAEPELSSRWEEFRGTSRLAWDNARDAVSDGWHRMERALPGDADRDGR